MRIKAKKRKTKTSSFTNARNIVLTFMSARERCAPLYARFVVGVVSFVVLQIWFFFFHSVKHFIYVLFKWRMEKKRRRNWVSMYEQKMLLIINKNWLKIKMILNVSFGLINYWCFFMLLNSLIWALGLSSAIRKEFSIYFYSDCSKPEIWFKKKQVKLRVHKTYFLESIFG